MNLEEELKEEFKKIEEQEARNSLKILNAFKEEKVSESDFNATTGYGYNDIGRDKLERIYKRVLGSEDALVRSQFISGSHALTVTLFALLRPGDTLLSITSKPYDTLDEVIGIRENKSSLKSFNISYKQIDLIDNDFDYEKIKDTITKEKIKVIEIQRSKGYSTRSSLNIDKVSKVVKFIKDINKDIIIMVDNCYCELVEDKTPCEVGADIMVGSLIKNLGGAIAPNGAYVAGRHDLIELVAERLTLPGEGREVGPSLGINKSLYQGFFFAPSVVAASLKTAVLTAYIAEKMGYKVEPIYNANRADIVQSIIFGNKEDLIKYCQEIQKYSPIDSFSTCYPAPMPGYDDEVIMASGSFTNGSSIELSCDGPIREPYIAYQQGSISYQYGKIAVYNAFKELKRDNKL